MQPDHFWAQCLSAIASIQTNQPGMAKLGLNACIEHEPQFAWLYLLRGFASGQAAVQARAAGKALKIEDGSIEAAVEAQFEAAEADYRQALELLERQAERRAPLRPAGQSRPDAVPARPAGRGGRRPARRRSGSTGGNTTPSPAWPRSSSGRRSGTRRSSSSRRRSRLKPELGAALSRPRRRAAGARRPVAGASRGGLARPGGRDPVREARQSRAGERPHRGAASCCAGTGGSRRPWRPATRP